MLCNMSMKMKKHRNSSCAFYYSYLSTRYPAPSLHQQSLRSRRCSHPQHNYSAYRTPSAAGGSRLEDFLHNIMKLFIHFFKRPAIAHRILTHFKTGGCNAACICSLRRSKEDSVCKEGFYCFRCRRHVCTLGNRDYAVCYERLSRLAVELVLGRAGEGDVALDRPDTAASFVIFCAGNAVYILLDSASLYLFNLLYNI